MTRSKLLPTALLSLALLAVVALSAAYQQMARPAFSYTEALYVTDVADPRHLAGMTENIFVGRVVAFEGTHYPDLIPESLFTVEVIDNVKGELKGQVTVNQQGGLWPIDSESKEAVLHLVNEDALLVPGQSYLFATLPDAAGRWHTVVPVYGDIAIKDAAHQAALSATFRDAVANQVEFDLADYAQD